MPATLLRSLLVLMLFGGCTNALAQERGSPVVEPELEPEPAHPPASSQTQHDHGGFTLPSCVVLVEAMKRRDRPAFLEAHRRLAVQHGRIEEGSTVDVRGSLSREQIREVITANNHVRDCYEDELVLHMDSELSGRMMTRFIIDPSGAVCHSESPGIQPEFEAVFACVSRQMRTWRFPPPVGGGIVTVNYPFLLSMDDSGSR